MTWTLTDVNHKNYSVIPSVFVPIHCTYIVQGPFTTSCLVVCMYRVNVVESPLCLCMYTDTHTLSRLPHLLIWLLYQIIANSTKFFTMFLCCMFKLLPETTEKTTTLLVFFLSKWWSLIITVSALRTMHYTHIILKYQYTFIDGYITMHVIVPTICTCVLLLVCLVGWLLV
jgi:hypothetical protein